MVVVVVVAIYTGYVSTEMLAATAAESAGVTAAQLAASGSVWAAGGAANAAVSAGLAGMASSATSQLLTTGSINGGQMFKAGATAALTAGILSAPILEGGQSINQLAGIKDVAGTGAKLANFSLDTLGTNLSGMALRGVATAGVNNAINGGSFGTAFKNSVVSDLAAVGANAVGQKTEVLSVENVGSHAALGAAAAKLSGNDAVAGGIGGATAALLNPLLDPYTSQTDATDRTVEHVAATMLASGAIANVFGRDGKTAANAAQNETLNNYLTANQLPKKKSELDSAKTPTEQQNVLQKYTQLSWENDARAANAVNSGVMATATLEQDRADLQHLMQNAGDNPGLKQEIQTNINRIDALLSIPEEKRAAELIRLGINTVAMLAPLAGPLLRGSTSTLGRLFSVSEEGFLGGKALSGANGGVNAEQGGLNLFKWGKENTTSATGWREGDYMLNLPSQGSPAVNWTQNSSRLRDVMREGQLIFDSYRDATTGMQIPTRGFLNAERNLLESRGWRYNSQTGAYHPPSR